MQATTTCYAVVHSARVYPTKADFTSAVHRVVPRGYKHRWNYLPLTGAAGCWFNGNEAPDLVADVLGSGYGNWTKQVGFFEIVNIPQGDLVHQRFLFSDSDTLRPRVFTTPDFARLAELAEVLLVARPTMQISFGVHDARLPLPALHLLGRDEKQIREVLLPLELRERVLADLKAHRDRVAEHYTVALAQLFAPATAELRGLIHWMVAPAS